MQFFYDFVKSFFGETDTEKKKEADVEKKIEKGTERFKACIIYNLKIGFLFY